MSIEREREFQTLPYYKTPMIFLRSSIGILYTTYKLTITSLPCLLHLYFHFTITLHWDQLPCPHSL